MIILHCRSDMKEKNIVVHYALTPARLKKHFTDISGKYYFIYYIILYYENNIIIDI